MNPIELILAILNSEKGKFIKSFVAVCSAIPEKKIADLINFMPSKIKSIKALV